MADEEELTSVGTPVCSPSLSPTTAINHQHRQRRHQLRIDLMDLPELNEEHEDHRVPFFARRRSEHTWVISLFIVVSLVAFVASMIVNDCPGNSGGSGDGGGGQCLFRPLGRFSFQPIYENPLLGPSAST